MYFLFSENLFEQKLFLDRDVPADRIPITAFEFDHSDKRRNSASSCYHQNWNFWIFVQTRQIWRRFATFQNNSVLFEKKNGGELQSFSFKLSIILASWFVRFKKIPQFLSQISIPVFWDKPKRKLAVLKAEKRRANQQKLLACRAIRDKVLFLRAKQIHQIAASNRRFQFCSSNDRT